MNVLHWNRGAPRSFRGKVFGFKATWGSIIRNCVCTSSRVFYLFSLSNIYRCIEKHAFFKSFRHVVRNGLNVGLGYTDASGQPRRDWSRRSSHRCHQSEPPPTTPPPSLTRTRARSVSPPFFLASARKTTTCFTTQPYVLIKRRAVKFLFLGWYWREIVL